MLVMMFTHTLAETAALKQDVLQLISLGGFNRKDAVVHLKALGHRISLRTLGRRLRSWNLTIKDKHVPTDDELKTEIADLQGRSKDRLGWQNTMEYIRYNQPSWRVQQKRVRHLLFEINPTKSYIRRDLSRVRGCYVSAGPNDCWHIDQYDTYAMGFPIHGCIDGFSRKLLWMKLVPWRTYTARFSSINPQYFFLDAPINAQWRTSTALLNVCRLLYLRFSAL